MSEGVVEGVVTHFVAYPARWRGLVKPCYFV
jgi:hypothetical protein